MLERSKDRGSAGHQGREMPETPRVTGAVGVDATPPSAAERRLEHPTSEEGGAAGAADAEVGLERGVDEAIEMTFPASDPPAWMPPGGRDRATR